MLNTAVLTQVKKDFYFSLPKNKNKFILFFLKNMNKSGISHWLRNSCTGNQIFPTFFFRYPNQI